MVMAMVEQYLYLKESSMDSAEMQLKGVAQRLIAGVPTGCPPVKCA